MLEKQKRIERGITLVALVVTIVVLLILAGITIATLFGDNGVINKAQKAKNETDRTAIEEQEGLNKTEEDMANAIKGNSSQGNSWTQPEPLKPEITNGEITLEIGDYVDYDCTNSGATYTSPAEKTGHTVEQIFKADAYYYGWRVLGVDKETKQLQLISEDFVQPTEGGKALGVRQAYNLQGQVGYVNGADELNKICNIYGTGEGATGARCVNIDDINWITGYNPNNTGVKDKNKTGNGTKCYSGQIYEYGNNVKYTLTSGGVKYEPSNSAASGTSSSYKQFIYYDETSKTWKSLATGGSVTLKSSRYYYYPTTLQESRGIDATIGIARTSTEYKMLFTNSSTGADTANIGKTDNVYYWLDSPCVETNTGEASFGLRIVKSGEVDAGPLYYSRGAFVDYSLGIRPVINLDSKVTLKDSGTMKDGCKLYNMGLNK